MTYDERIEAMARAIAVAFKSERGPLPSDRVAARAADAACLAAIEEPTEEMVESSARGVSDSFREEGFSPEHDPPSLWEEYRRAGRLAFENAFAAIPKGDK